MGESITIDMRKLADSGIGTYLRAIVPRVIAAQVKSRPELCFHLLGNAAAMRQFAWAEAANIRLIDCPVPPLSLREQWELPRYLPQKTSLLWMTHFNIPLLSQGKLLVTVHDIFPAALPELATKGQRLYIWIMLRAIRRKAEKILAVSEFTKNELIRYGHFDRNRIETVLSGIEPFWFGAEQEEKPHPKPYLLFVGNVKPNKNLIALLKAFEQIQNKIPHDLIIVGKKEGFRVGDQPVLTQAARLGERVIFTGFVDDRMLRRYFHSASALVFPSLYEGFGLPPLEAMACGLPVLCSNLAALPEVCGEAALYFDPKNSADIAAQIVRYVQEPSLRAQMQARGKIQAAQFDWDRSAAKTSQVISELLA